MSDSLLCDATTSSGKPCKNSALGDIGGRNYCRVASHQAQIEALVEGPEDVPEEEAVEEAPEAVETSPDESEEIPAEGPAEPEEVTEEAVEETVEEVLPALTADSDCPSCGNSAPHRTVSSSVVMCRNCLHRWDY
jgi:hypothetical protein